MAILGGFPAQTLVRTNNGYVPIEHLSVGDIVVCLDVSGKPVEKEIVHKKLHSEHGFIRIVLDDTFIITSRYQKFYLPAQKKWKMAKDLASGDFFLGKFYRQILVKEVIIENQAIDLYDISVKDCHNFFVLKDDVLVHNFAPALIFGVSWAAGVFSMEAVKCYAALGIIGLGGFIGCELKKVWNRSDDSGFARNVEFSVCGESSTVGASNYTKAPGIPTEKDGFFPPKNWNGEKVKHPRGYGWKDKDGNIWIPSGENGHGGPHWDVQHSGGDYTNIVPGGKVRGAK